MTGLLLVLTTIVIITTILGVNNYITASGNDYYALLVFAAIIGFSGSIISLLLSKQMAKSMMNGAIRLYSGISDTVSSIDLFCSISMVFHNPGNSTDNVLDWAYQKLDFAVHSDRLLLVVNLDFGITRKITKRRLIKMWHEFKEFAMKGNVLDLAIAVVIGGAFGKIVTSLVNDLIMPLVGLLMGGLDFAGLSLQVGSAVVKYGAFIQSVVDFLIIAFSIFLVIKAVNRRKKKEETVQEEAPVISDEVKLLSEIRDLLKAQQ